MGFCCLTKKKELKKLICWAYSAQYTQYFKKVNWLACNVSISYFAPLQLDCKHNSAKCTEEGKAGGNKVEDIFEISSHIESKFGKIQTKKNFGTVQI